ncbi:MAG: glycosyltransferase family 1 protein [Lachnospiraceae bacterium]|nr:glycosyltransferase family 1 protein [Lachnospiraceae bacterium]
MKKSKVLHLELSGQVGGIESFLTNLYSSMNQELIQFDFITQVNNPAKEFEMKQMGGNIFKVSSYKNPVKYIEDLQKVLEKGYEAIHIHKNSAANILPFIAIQKYKKKQKVIVHAHNTAPSIGKSTIILHKLNKNYLWKHSEYHLACSDLAGQWLYGRNNKFNVVKNGIDIKKYLFHLEDRKRIRNILGIPGNAFIVGHIGRFTKQKNHKRLISIFREINLKNKNSYLLLIGTGELEYLIKEIVFQMNLEKNIIFLGMRNDVPCLLNAMDVFFMPSIYEGLPIAAIEAQASGLPTILSDTISHETEITDAVSWISLEERDTAIADRILHNECEFSLRLNRNQQAIDSGYDIKMIGEYMSKIYLTGSI